MTLHDYRTALKRAGLLGVSLACLPVKTGDAATAAGNLTVTANVSATCSVSTDGIDFGAINNGAITDEATPGEIRVLCTAEQPGATVTLGPGQNENSGQRRLASGANFMPYNLHRDAPHTDPIAVNGNVFTGTFTAATTQTITIYGQVPANTYVAGTYTDVITVTVTY